MSDLSQSTADSPRDWVLMTSYLVEKRFPGDRTPMTVFPLPMPVKYDGPVPLVTNENSWLEDFLYIPTDDAHLLSQQMINSICNPGCASIAAYFCEFHPDAVVLYKQDLLLRFANRRNNRHIYWQKPLDLLGGRNLAHQIVAGTPRNTAEISGFLQLIFGKRFSPPGMGGYFLPSPANSAERLSDLLELSAAESPNFVAEWTSSTCLFFALNGDLLLVSQTGQASWFSLSENRIKNLSTTVVALFQILDEYVDSGRSLDGLDSYSCFESGK